MSQLRRYRGNVQKLVLAFDVGTTFSGVSYALLDPGKIPEVKTVTRYPKQGNAAGDSIGNSKVPSVLYYASDGTLEAVGAEAALLAEAQGKDENLIFVEWFKLHLCPETLDADEDLRARTPPLPAGKTVVDVFADFLRYLFECAREFIVENEKPNGERFWSSVQGQIEFVLSHPNGWEGAQQAKMRRAAIQAGLVPDDLTGHARIYFVSEGEASLHFCVHIAKVAGSLKNGDSVIVIDAGGGTVDLSMYRFTKMNPLTIEEVATPICIMHGSTTVNARAQAFLEGMELFILVDPILKVAFSAALKSSKNKDKIQEMLSYFEKYTKPDFKNPKEPSYIQLNTKNCKDDAIKIRRGRVTLSGSNVASFFAPAITAICNAALKQRTEAPTSVKGVFLVGGFAASPWLYSQLQQTLRPFGLTVTCPQNHHQTKAVAVGAVVHHIENWVSARVASVTYGVPASIVLDMTDMEHLQRLDDLYCHPSGLPMIPGRFDVILARGRRFRQNEEIREPYSRCSFDESSLNVTVGPIMCYRGSSKDPRWLDTEPDKYSIGCMVRADTSRVERKRVLGRVGWFYIQQFDIVLICGLTELQAQISWTENGEEKRGPAEVIYADDIDSLDST
ncbi:hypothetical protein WOLCODRAFT_20691 [Wolfiporia cocos MD-104 SS10]|uniref:Actin-like ATPase domain-containing protein n=1 Tax=Wolfiporia cocos (strain MD-104) TaxID=742152 RepID=A0A2H3JG71_WOLCO|nr:hypothetical protein WOLCODRAFT_20691 [Wolfiporia cocos MD-104 SS10]